MRSLVILALLALLPVDAGTPGDLEGLFWGGLDHPAIEYPTRRVDNTVSQLNREIHLGMGRLEYDGPSGYLRSLLEALAVPWESQIIVFSKTSLMSDLIGPRNPRHIFFNDSVAVALVPGEPFVELAAVDARQGVIFYTLNQVPMAQPHFDRRDECLSCHHSYGSLGVPGMMVRSVFPDASGLPVRSLGDYVSDHRTPFQERWGGWYVTGKSLPAGHLGNVTVTSTGAPDAVTTTAIDVPSFDGHSTSDVVALMVFEHQMHMVNLLTRMGWEVRAAVYEEAATPAPGPRTRRVLAETARDLVDYLLFVDEALLKGSVEGSSGFAEKFSGQGPRDRQGRSLRQFDLHRRLMRYPCSYMIYSRSFDGLPDLARDAIYRRLWQVLSGEVKGERYARISASERRAIVEILRETRNGLPDYFRPVAGQASNAR